ncbi:MAG: acyltransferase [Elusimicrobia bacterium]|nr:acyltransferase [Elusimicrobiota bacterium]
MREISNVRQAQIGVWVSVWAGATLFATWVFAHRFPWGGGVAHAGTFIFFWFVFGVAGYRSILALVPLRPGDMNPGSQEEWVFQVIHLPFNFFLFDPVVRSGLLPTCFSAVVYRLFGARLGKNTYPGHSTLFDPLFVEIGDSVSLGHQATLVPHVMEGERMGCFPIQIEDGVTIGVNAVILAGVTIGKGAVVAAGAVVHKFTCIGPNEIWAGLPARRIGTVNGPSGLPAGMDRPLPSKDESVGVSR